MPHQELQITPPDTPFEPPTGAGLFWWWTPLTDPGLPPALMAVSVERGRLVADAVWSPDGRPSDLKAVPVEWWRGWWEPVASPLGGPPPR